ncbi:MAG: PDZ domain-containing protein [Acidobacteria bacterium]|nr:PDZ domain-containing protein [Acidobacteriota bacterium]
MFVRLYTQCAFLTATAAMALLSLPALAQPTTPPPAAPPEPPRYKVMTLGGSVSYLGIGVMEINADRAKELKLKEEAGVEVTRVDSNSPAEKAGLKAGDAVLEYQGNRVEGSEQFVRFVRETPVGRTVKMKVFRAGNAQTLTATISARQNNVFGMSQADRERVEKEMARMRERIRTLPEIRMPDVPHAVMGWRSGMLGIDGESVEDQLADFFGVKEGVLVRGIAKDMPAAKAGIKAGDVIVRVEDKSVRTPRDITAAIRSAKNRKPLKVTISRQRSEMTLDVQLEDEKPMTPRGVTVSRPQDFEF